MSVDGLTKEAIEQGRLPFSEKKQEALLGHLLQHEKFFHLARGTIQPAWFQSPWVNRVWAAKLLFYKQFSRPPSLAELKESPPFLLATPQEQQRLNATIQTALLMTQEYGLDVLRKELDVWMHARIYREGVERSSTQYNAGHIEEANAILLEMSRTINLTSFERDNAWKWEEYSDHFERTKLERKNACTFGLQIMDSLLLPEGECGSLLPGDTTIMLAPTNVGKTTVKLTIGRHNIFRRKSVLLITHEGRPADIADKLWCSILNVSKPVMYQWYENPETRKRLDRVMHLLKEYVTYVPFNKAGGTIEEVEQLVRRRQEDRIARYGHGYDLVIDDYPAKLTTAQAAHGRMETRNVLLEVYNRFVQLALEYEFHAVLAIQSNREGAKINRGLNGHERLLTMEDVSEAYGPMQIATNVITINRDPAAEARDRVTYLIAKSRSNEKNFAVVCKSKYGHCITHHDKLGATWYKGTAALADQVDALLEQYAGREVDRSAIQEALVDAT